ncbi:MAG: phosphatidylglycerol lysyltransferase domain-containing protein [Cetobacterium sp.]
MKWLNKNSNKNEYNLSKNEIQKIQHCLFVSKNESGFLALLNDKKFFFYPENSKNCCFIMYGEKGNSYIAMGDPIGYEEFFEQAVKEFKKFCKNKEKKCIFYNFKGLKLFKDKFKPEWEPVYIAYAGHLIFLLVLKDIISLTSGGIVSAIRKTKKL